MNLSHDEIQKTVTPLAFIFWGGLLCIFDVTFSVGGPGGLRFDIINDFVGMLMITSGVYLLGKINVHDRYRKAMVFVTVIAVLSCIDAFQEHVIYQSPPFLSFLLSVLAALAMAAAVVFCLSMRWLCSEAGHWSGLKHFVDIDRDGRCEFIHTRFVNGRSETARDGKRHNYWVYNILQLQEGRLIVRNKLARASFFSSRHMIM